MTSLTSLKRKNSQIQGSERIKKTKLDRITIVPDYTMKCLSLNADSTSRVNYVQLDPEIGGLTMQEFEELYALKPEKPEQVKMYGKIVDCPRFTKSFLNSYNYGNLNHEAEKKPLPAPLAKMLAFVRQMSPDVNQVLVNWYDSNGSIGLHSDDTRQLKHHSNIFSITLGPAVRNFILEPRDRSFESCRGKEYAIKVWHNTMLIMAGACQETHRHAVPRHCNTAGVSNQRRINVTFRCKKI